jgi:hypothetical protein
MLSRRRTGYIAQYAATVSAFKAASSNKIMEDLSGNSQKHGEALDALMKALEVRSALILCPYDICKYTIC